jgi:hypothetical protein
MKKGGGWSSDKNKSNPEKRKEAVFTWFSMNESKLNYLKKSYLEDNNLYNDGGGKEKRNFIIRLLIKIVKEKAHLKLTFAEADNYLSSL